MDRFGIEGIVTERNEEGRALEIVQDVLGKLMGIVEAAIGLLPLLRMNPALASQEDFDLMRAIASETDDLPIGRVRELWHSDVLPEKDREIRRVEGLWREQMLLACERMRRTLLVRKLVISRHLNVSERKIVGAVSRREVAAIVKSELLAHGVFPAEAREGFGYEGAALGRTALGVQLIQRRSYVHNPRVTAESRVERFADFGRAIDAFLDCEWNQGIDGIPLI